MNRFRSRYMHISFMSDKYVHRGADSASLTQSMSPFTAISIASSESLFRSVWKASTPKSQATEKSLLTADVVRGALLFTADQEDAGVSGCSDGVHEEFGATAGAAAER